MKILKFSFCVSALMLPFLCFSEDTFFRYKVLSEGVKSAITNYIQNNRVSDAIVVYISKNDSSFTLNSDFGPSELLESPPLYYSIYKKMFVVIYNGDENNYFPSYSTLALMFDFVSKFVDFSAIIECDWQNYVFKEFIKTRNHPFVIYDPPWLKYKIKNEKIIDITNNEENLKPKVRFNPQFILVYEK